MSQQSSLINFHKKETIITKGFGKRKTTMSNGHHIDQHARKEAVVAKLVRGRDAARKLQEIIQLNPVEEVSMEELVSHILTSLTESLNELKFCTSSAQTDEISTVDCAGESSSGETKKVNDRRGCYKRRKTTDSWSAVSPTMEDCYAWRKYGQKRIINAEFPRCYYRCTHKTDGCKALKQVERTQNEPVILYQITYFHHHTCNKNNTPTLLVDSEPVDPNLISFGGNNNNANQERPLIKPPTLKQEAKHDTDDQEDSKSTVDVSWDDIDRFDELGPYNSVMSTCHHRHHQHNQVASGFGSSGSTCLNDLGIEVGDDQLGDIDSFGYIFNAM